LDDALQSKYRHVFLSPIGREVLADILGTCHFGATLDPDNKAQIAEHNVGTYILFQCGVLGPDRDMDVINALINSLTSSRKKEEK